MTRKEAKKILRSWDGVYIGYSSDEVEEAHNMAIQALSQEPKSGKWMLNKEKSHFFDVYECSNCGKISGLTNYCPNCGSEMESEE